MGEKKVLDNGDTLYHRVGNFSFTNQYGENINEKNINGKIVVSDFFFATCQSICPRMSSQMRRLQDSCKNAEDIVLLSHTVNPMHDTVEVLKQYGEKYGAIKGKWHLLTGEKRKIYNLAKDAYLVNAVQDDGTEEGFLHSETFLLLDQLQRIRGIYDGTDSLQVNKLIKDIRLLRKENNGKG